MPPAYWRSWINQIAHGESAAFFCDQSLLAVGGLYPLSESVKALWFCTMPDARRSMIPLFQAFQLTLREACESQTVTVRAFVAHGWTPSQKLLRLMGFHYQGQIPGFEIWDLSFGRKP